MAGIFGLLMSGAGVIKDQYYNLTSLLLPGNGTNGAQNNTFLDSGTANSGSGFTITRNGNATQGTFSPFSQTGWGAYFDGSDDYLSIADSEAFNFGSSDFTVEMMVYLTGTSTAAAYRMTGQCSSAVFDADLSFSILKEDTTDKYLSYVRSGSTNYETRSSISAIRNAWVHIALVRSGGNLNQYINGQLDGQSTALSTNAINNSTKQLSIGRQGELNAGYFAGNIASYRIVKGVAVYTGNFTPPTKPLAASGADSAACYPSTTNVNTSFAASACSLLTCQANRFRDASNNTFTVTPNNGVAITPFSPFAPTQFYSAAAVGGSGYFDGTGDYLDVTDNAAFTLGSGDFTIEFWFYPTLGSTSQYIFNQNANVITNASFAFLFTNTNAINAGIFSGTTEYAITSSAVALNAWHHVAIARSGSNYSLFIDGSRVSAPTNVGTNSINDATAAVRVGALADVSNSFPFKGYVSGARFVKGTAVYDPTQTTLTVPTAPPTAVTNTQLLLNFTNAGVVDATAKNVLETVGNAQISTTQSKWGGGSMYFNGSSSYLMGAANQQYEFGSGDFTVECWVNISAAASDAGIVGKGPVGSVNNTIWSIEFVGTGNTIGFYVPAAAGSFIITGTTNMKTSTWIHVAVCKSGNNTRLFINGTQEGSTYTTGYTISAGNNLYVGGGFYAPTTRTITGYVDDLRFTKFARYTANFTPPTAPFPVQ